MNNEKPKTKEVQDGKAPPSPELEDAKDGGEADIAIPTPLEPGDGDAQPV